MQQVTGCFLPGVSRPANGTAADPPPASNHRADWCLRDPASTNETVAKRSGGVRVGVGGQLQSPRHQHTHMHTQTERHPRLLRAERARLERNLHKV